MERIVLKQFECCIHFCFNFQWQFKTMGNTRLVGYAKDKPSHMPVNPNDSFNVRHQFDVIEILDKLFAAFASADSAVKVQA
jgi:hypothetical protein